MTAKSNLINMALCLTLVCFFCAGVLGGVHALTAEPIADAARKSLVESLDKVLPKEGTIGEAQTAELDGVKYLYYKKMLNDTTVTAYAVKSVTIGFSGSLTVMVGVLPDGTVYNTSVLEHSETPGLGAKCENDERFLSQFRMLKPGKKLLVKKDGGDLDAITASTITSRAYSKAVANAIALVKSLEGRGDE